MNLSLVHFKLHSQNVAILIKFIALIQELRQAFRIFDKNKDGYIEAKELKYVTTTLGQVLSNEEIEAFMAEADLDGNGKLDYNEFVKMMTTERERVKRC